jgi:trehalose/maltose hydrolase-like predicted phosphorylase
MSNLWSISEGSFDPDHQHRGETIFTIGNGYLATRGTFEQGYAGEGRAKVFRPGAALSHLLAKPEQKCP